VKFLKENERKVFSWIFNCQKLKVKKMGLFHVQISEFVFGCKINELF
jgi:hypothetical protein